MTTYFHRVEVLQLSVVVVLISALESHRRQTLIPIRHWLRKFLRVLYNVKLHYENFTVVPDTFRVGEVKL
jgi:hypothetical protein